MKNLFLVAAIAMGAMFVGVNQADAGGCGYSNWNSGNNWNSGFNRSYSNRNYSPYQNNFRRSSGYGYQNNYQNFSHSNRNLRMRQFNGYGYGY